MTPTLHTGWWFNGSSGQSSFSRSDYKLTANANLFKVSPKRMESTLFCSSPSVKQTNKKRPQIPKTASFIGWGRVPPVVLQGFAHWTGPAKPCAHGSMQPAIVRFSIHGEVGFHVMCGDRLLVQRVGGLWVTEKTQHKEYFRSGTKLRVILDQLWVLTISYLARERALWKRENSLQSWTVMTNFQTASSTTPTRRILPTTASRTMRTSVPAPHSERTKLRFLTPTIGTWNQHFGIWPFPLAERAFFIHFCAQLSVVIATPAEEIQGGSVLLVNVGGNPVPLRWALKYLSLKYVTQQVKFIAAC